MKNVNRYGRENMGLLFSSKTAIEPDYMRKKKAVEKEIGRKLTNEEFEESYLKIGGGAVD